MIIADIAFYLFASSLIVAAVMVITLRNPVHSVLCLILAFFNSAALFLLNGAEFIAMLMVIVYVGAVAVLFLFVVMMMDINVASARQGFIKYLPFGAGIGLVLLAELIFMFLSWTFLPDEYSEKAASYGVPYADGGEISNTAAIGHVLYTDYIYLFQIAGLILLVAMIGAIVLTHRKRPSAKKQNIIDQITRRPGDVLEVKKVKTGEGI
jgi:NADH-quinone oxidoreductase subunit J